jgi:FkbM family methyltransferase
MKTPIFHLPKHDTWYLRKYKHPLHHEQEEFKLAVANSNTDTMAIDVGANCGVWTCKLSKYFNHVKAYEPLEEIFSALAKNATAINTEIYRLAVGSQQSQVYMTSLKNNTGGSFIIRSKDGMTKLLNDIKRNPSKLDKMNYPQLVTQTTIDKEIQDQHVGFIKIDVEGYELEVLKGAKQTIQNFKPVIMVEISEYVHHKVWGYDQNLKNHINKIKSLLYDIGYEHMGQIGRNFFFSTKRLKHAIE